MQIMSRTAMMFAVLAALPCGQGCMHAYKENKICVINDINIESDPQSVPLYPDLDTGHCVPCDTLLDRRSDYRGTQPITLVLNQPCHETYKTVQPSTLIIK